MKTKKTIFLLLFNLALLTGFSQTLVGTWKIKKHITTYNNDKYFDCTKLNGQNTFIIKDNGTYEIITKDLKGQTWTTYGQWKISADKKTFTLYNNKFKPQIDNSVIADRTYNIEKLNQTEFNFKENQCSEDFEGTSYYVRSK